MSNQAMNWAMRQRGLTPEAKLMLLHLARHCDPDSGKCDMSQRLLARDCEIDVRTVKRQLKVLGARGISKSVPAVEWNAGMWAATSYVLLADLSDQAHETEAIAK